MYENPNKDKICNHCKKKGHVEASCWEKHPDKIPKKVKAARNKAKACKSSTAAVAIKEEIILGIVESEKHSVSLIDVKDAHVCVPVEEESNYIFLDSYIKNVEDKESPNLEEFDIHDILSEEEVDTLEVTIQTPEEREGTHMDSSLDKTDGWTVHRTRSGRKVGRKDGQYDPLTGKTIMWSDALVATEESSTKSMTQLNHYDVLGINENEMQVIKSHNDALTKYVNVGAGIGGGFTNTQELKVMKYHEAINGPDGDA
jgi:hypothetical protein